MGYVTSHAEINSASLMEKTALNQTVLVIACIKLGMEFVILAAIKENVDMIVGIV